jgi:hypothetical protein
MVWEVPLLGPEFALLRGLANLPLPILAGLLARKLPGIAARVPPPGEGDLAADLRAAEAQQAQERMDEDAAKALAKDARPAEEPRHG